MVKKKNKQKSNKKCLNVLIIIIIFIGIALLFFKLGWYLHSNHIEYKTCKLAEEDVNKGRINYLYSLDCAYFGKKDYCSGGILKTYESDDKNIHIISCEEKDNQISFDNLKETTEGYEWQNDYPPYNLTKDIFAHVCKESGDIIYGFNSSGDDLFLMTCVSGQEYNIILTNLNDTVTINTTILTKDYIPYFKNLETNETYLVNNGSFDILIQPFETAYLSYNPEEADKIVYIEKCKEIFGRLDLTKEEIELVCQSQYETHEQLSNIHLDFGGTNFTIYDDSLVLYFNFDNRSELGGDRED